MLTPTTPCPFRWMGIYQYDASPKILLGLDYTLADTKTMYFPRIACHDANAICLNMLLPTPLLSSSRRGVGPSFISVRVTIAKNHSEAA